MAPLSDHEQEVAPEVQEIGDELLRLIFTCCHPAISPDAQVALILREVCEMTTEEIASAFLTPTSTIAQRIVRAKSKIREAAIPFEVPDRDELPARLDAALRAIYLVFNEGYAPSSGNLVTRPELMALAIHLGRQLIQISPVPEALGLSALMMIHHARSATRATKSGEIILLEDQDRSKWDRTAIAEASAWITEALGSGVLGPYVLQAAIACVHAESPSCEATDWAEIVGLYDLLLSVEPSPIVALNRAVALAMRDGVSAGIEQISSLIDSGPLAEYHRAYVARAELYRRSKNLINARTDYEKALSLVRQDAERILIQKNLEKIVAEN